MLQTIHGILGFKKALGIFLFNCYLNNIMDILIIVSLIHNKTLEILWLKFYFSVYDFREILNQTKNYGI